HDDSFAAGDVFAHHGQEALVEVEFVGDSFGAAVARWEVDVKDGELREGADQDAPLAVEAFFAEAANNGAWFARIGGDAAVALFFGYGPGAGVAWRVA